MKKPTYAEFGRRLHDRLEQAVKDAYSAGCRDTLRVVDCIANYREPLIEAEAKPPEPEPSAKEEPKAVWTAMWHRHYEDWSESDLICVARHRVEAMERAMQQVSTLGPFERDEDGGWSAAQHPSAYTEKLTHSSVYVQRWELS